MNVPKIRFKEFSDEWCETTLGETTTFKQGIQVDVDKQFSKPFDNSVRFIRIVDYTQNTKDIRYISKPANANYVDEHDVVLVRYGATAGFVGHGIKGVIANNMFTVTPNSSINKDFLYTILKQDKIYNKLNSSNGSSAMPALNFGSVSILKFSYPSIDEQNKLTNLINLLDKKIELQTKKIEDLKLFKKGLDKIIFSNQSLFDEDTIKNRFYSDGGTALEEYISNSGTHRIISIGNYSTTGTYIDNGQKIILNDKTKTKLLNKDNLVMILNDKTTTGDIIGSSILIEEDNKYIYNQRSQRLICKNINPKYAWCYLNNNNFRKHVFKLAQGGTQIYVNFSTIENQIILIPKNEQIENMIINSIIGIKDKTDKETVKLNKLIELKKGLMQCMFV